MPTPARKEGPDAPPPLPSCPECSAAIHPHAARCPRCGAERPRDGRRSRLPEIVLTALGVVWFLLLVWFTLVAPVPDRAGRPEPGTWQGLP